MNKGLIAYTIRRPRRKCLCGIYLRSKDMANTVPQNFLCLAWNYLGKNHKILLDDDDEYCRITAQENERQQEDKKMITINNRNELENFLYGEDSTSPDTLVGIARIGGELLAEALTNELSDGTFYIGDFFPMGDEGEEIVVDANGNVLSDGLYY